LADGPNPYDGVVQVYRHGNWTNVCADDFGPPEARVVCRNSENGTDM